MAEDLELDDFLDEPDLDVNKTAQYIERSPNRFEFSPAGVSTLPAGVYAVEGRRNQPVLERRQWVTDSQEPVLSETLTEIRRRVHRCLAQPKTERQGRRLRKRGVLLFGPPGCGKSTLLYVLGADVVRAGGIVLITENPYFTERALQFIRHLEPERPILHVLEDVDQYSGSPYEAALLNVLDGNAQVDRIVTVATTNYPDELDERYTKRPGRFDELHELSLPHDDERRRYLAALLKETPAELSLDTWVAKTNEFTFAQLRELFTSVVELDEPFTDALRRVGAMSPGSGPLKPKKRRTGFRPGHGYRGEG